MNKEGKTIEELLKEYYNRPLELIEENKKLKKKIDKLQKELDNSISKDIIRNKIKEVEKNYESCSKGNVVEKAYYRNKIDTLKELLGG